jgi:YjjG family noncanonical pyrimidine nucleotidase
LSTFKKYKTIFFDLDHTLWDYETNSKETLQELYEAYQLQQKGVTTFTAFHEIFNKVNEELWYLYDRNLISSEVIREERFKKILAPFQVKDEKLTADLSYDYLYTCPRKGALLPDALDVLNYLKEKYALSLITNGFEEIQNMKLASAKIAHYFDHIITSQKAGHKKPAREIFDYALGLHCHGSQHAIMIGDNLLTDMAGAKNADVDTIFLNPKNQLHSEVVTHQINELSELHSLL